MDERGVGKVIALAALIWFSFSGCAIFKPEIRTEVKEVFIPVPVECPQPPKIDEPVVPKVKYVSPIDDLGIVCIDESNAKNLLVVIQRLKLQIKQLEEALMAYRKKEIADASSSTEDRALPDMSRGDGSGK